MPTSVFTHNDLPAIFTRLEASLLYWRYLDAGIWPVYEWEDAEVKTYTRRFYCFSHECLAMHLNDNVPETVDFATDKDDWLEQKPLIALIRQLLFYCNVEHAADFRLLSLEEQQLIITLQQIHSALVGACYMERPGETTVDSYYMPGKNR